MGYKEKFNELIEQRKNEEARALLEEYKAFAYDDGFYFGNMGWVLNRIGRYQEAVIYLQKGVHTFPEDAWMHAQLGYSYIHSQQVEDGIESMLKGLNSGYDEPWIHAEIGWAYCELKDYDKAIEYYENALLDDPDNVQLNAQVASAYHNQGNKKTAEEYLQKVYRLSPDDDSLYDLAMFYKNESRYEDEIEILDKVVGEEYCVWRDFEKGFAYNRLERVEEAMALFLSCLEKGKNDTNLHEELGDVYRKINDMEASRKHYEIALEYYESALKNDIENSIWILHDMVWIAEKMDDTTKKFEYLDRLCKLDPNDSWAWYQYAKTYSNLEEYEKALSYCEKSIKITGEIADICSLKAWIFRKMGQYDDSIKELKKLEEKGRNDEWLYNELGWNYSEIENYKESAFYYEKSVSLNGEDAWTLSQLAWVKGMLNEYEDAITWFLKAETHGRKDGWIYANMGWNYSKLKEYKKAMKYFNYAQNMGYHEPWFHGQMAYTRDELKKLLDEKKLKKE